MIQTLLMDRDNHSSQINPLDNPQHNIIHHHSMDNLRPGMDNPRQDMDRSSILEHLQDLVMRNRPGSLPYAGSG